MTGVREVQSHYEGYLYFIWMGRGTWELVVFHQYVIVESSPNSP